MVVLEITQIEAGAPEVKVEEKKGFQVTALANGQKFYVEVEKTDTIPAVKQKIHKQSPFDMAKAYMTHNGNLLKDDKTVESSGIKEKDFIVVELNLKGGQL